MNENLNQILIPGHMEYMVLDKNLVIETTSANLLRFAEVPAQLSIGSNIIVGFPELIGVEDLLIAVLEGQQESFDLKAIARTDARGNNIYIDLYFIQDKNQEREEKKLILFVEDVTERMMLEQRLVQATNETDILLKALGQKQKYINHLITSIPDPLLVTTEKGKIKRVNKAAKELFGYEERELINQQISRILGEDNLLLQVIQYGGLSDGELLNNLEVSCQTKRGEEISVAFSCSAIQTEIEDLQDLIYVGRDITRSQRAQQRLVAQYTTTRILSESATITQAIPKLLQAICESMEWDIGEFWRPTKGEESEEITENLNLQEYQGKDNYKYLRCVQSWVRPSVKIPEFREMAKSITPFRGAGLEGKIWESCSSQWIKNVVDDGSLIRSKIAAKEGLHGAFGFPIKSDGEVLGVISFYSREEKEVDEDLLQTTAVIGSQLGEFIKRKRAELALQESEERYRDLFENASDLIQSVAADGKILYVNTAWRERLGYSEAEVAQLNLFDIIHPDCKEEVISSLKRVMAGEKVGQLKAEFITKEGNKLWVEGNANCKLVEGIAVANRGIFRDITERLQAEEALRQSEANLAEAQKIAHVGSWTFDVATQTMSWSDEMFRIYGMEPKLPAPTYAEQLQQVHHQDRKKWEKKLQVAIADGEAYELDFRIVRQDGQIRHINGRCECICNEGGETERILGTAIDITERKQMNAALRYQKLQTERLLHNILPARIAERLKQAQSAIAESFDNVTVMFADIVGFTEISARRSPTELVEMLNLIFSKFDQLSELHGLEKIKTIGDAYMVVGGLPVPRSDHAEAIAEMALDMQKGVSEFNAEIGEALQIRIGINSGPVVAGVIGTKKFIYDLWGDTVNTASRMESHGIPGSIQVTTSTYELLRDKYHFTVRGPINIKGKGPMTTYLLAGKLSEAVDSDR
ncbi:MAG: adenylate/guanylate cyclase domain-containing protein [Hormoscilla sp.]